MEKICYTCLMQPYEGVEKSKKKIAIDNFIGGITWALGVFVGGTIVVTIIALIFRKVDLIPIIGTFVVNITKYVQGSPQLVK